MSSSHKNGVIQGPGSQKYFREYLRENENILGYYSRDYAKPKVKKSHAKIPLI